MIEQCQWKAGQLVMVRPDGEGEAVPGMVVSVNVQQRKLYVICLNGFSGLVNMEFCYREIDS